MTDNRTTELREKLAKLGVEYETNDFMGACETSWNGFTATQLSPNAKLIMVVTPEQAIAATLGNSRAERTCHDDNIGGSFVCSKCGANIKDTYVGRSYVDKFGKRWYATSNGQAFNYCPNCGRKVSA